MVSFWKHKKSREEGAVEVEASATATTPPASPREDSPTESESPRQSLPSLTAWKEKAAAAYETASTTVSTLSQQAASMKSDEERAAEATTPPASPNEDSLAESRQDAPSSLLGPFDFDNSGSALSFPPLFHEADDMLNLANLIYTLVELRNLARNGGLECPQTSKRILEMPLPLCKAVQILLTEKEALLKALDEDAQRATLSALESLLKRQKEMAASMQEKKEAKEEAEAGGKKKESTVLGWITHLCLNSSTDEPEAIEVASKQLQEEAESSVMTAIGDARNEEELVYAVGVNPSSARVTVTFRGSVTKADFMTDAKISIVQAPDPRTFNGAEGDGSDGGNVGIHQGFYEYLFGGSDGKPSKYAEIMNHIDQLLEEKPVRKTYKLYITGHSLGGALSTLFGFYAAGSPSLPLPVTVVSVASPRVGNVDFARTFLEMESQGRIRHLRIANHQDPVTLGPTVSSKRALALSAKAFSPLGYLALVLTGNTEGGEEEVYYHTGIKMKLFKGGAASASSQKQCTLSYSGARLISGNKNPDAIDKDDVADMEQSNRWKKKENSAELPMVSYHYGETYSERMALAEPELKGLTLNDLYREMAARVPSVG